MESPNYEQKIGTTFKLEQTYSTFRFHVDFYPNYGLKYITCNIFQD